MTAHQGEFLGAIIAALVIGALVAGAIYRNHCDYSTKQTEEQEVAISDYLRKKRPPNIDPH